MFAVSIHLTLVSVVRLFCLAALGGLVTGCSKIGGLVAEQIHIGRLRLLFQIEVVI